MLSYFMVFFFSKNRMAVFFYTTQRATINLFSIKYNL
jgi:hypothetical protein